MRSTPSSSALPRISKPHPLPQSKSQKGVLMATADTSNPCLCIMRTASWLSRPPDRRATTFFLGAAPLTPPSSPAPSPMGAPRPGDIQTLWARRSQRPPFFSPRPERAASAGNLGMSTTQPARVPPILPCLNLPWPAPPMPALAAHLDGVGAAAAYTTAPRTVRPSPISFSSPLLNKG